MAGKVQAELDYGAAARGGTRGWDVLVFKQQDNCPTMNQWEPHTANNMRNPTRVGNLTP